MIHLICIIVAVGAALMPETALPDMLNLLAAGMAPTTCVILALSEAAIDQAVQQGLETPDPRLRYGGWVIILVAASMVHWFPLACFVFVFLVETAFYSRVQEKQND
jgi:hypothetical protein